MHLTEINGLPCYRSSRLGQFPEVAHGFFTRQGGESQGPYESLNLSFTVGDVPGRVAANRRRVEEALGLEGLASALQVHGRREAVIAHPQANLENEVPEVDILISRRPRLGLLIKQADCQAVMFYDPRRRVVANVHCGWRGNVQNILGEAVQALRARCRCRPEDLFAVIGPGLGPCCAEFRHFRREFPPELWSYQVRPTYFDLWRLSQEQLAAAGVPRDRIEVAGLCTRCHPQAFFSYRRDKVTGRQGAVIALI
ncbi:MAG: laccase domain-containing protein [Deltaproteobacteria bacterium]|nr:laccase domain-containing protein [Deltaproteobacteria bacterium]